MAFPECKQDFFKAPFVIFVGPCILGLSQQKKGTLVLFLNFLTELQKKTHCYNELSNFNKQAIECQ